MSWAEVSKINSDFMDVPLDKRLDLADYKMYGEKSHVFQNKDRLHSLYECVDISMNDHAVNGEALDYLLKTQNAGEVLTLIHELEQKEQIRRLSTMPAIANDTTAMTAVLKSNTAISAIANSITAMTAVANSTTAMTAVLNSDETVKKFVNSPLIREVKLTGDTWNYPPQTTPVKGIIISFYCSDTNNALTVRKIDDMVVTDRNDDRNAADAGKREWKIWLARYSKNPAYNVMKKSITVAAHYANCAMRYIPIN